MRAIILLGLVLALPATARPVTTPTWMKGEHLLQLLTFPPNVKGNLDMTPGQYLDAERARFYIEGVHDSSAGRSWCYREPYPPGPDVVREAVIIGLRKLSPDQLRRNASELMVEIWSKRWPCTEGGSTQ